MGADSKNQRLKEGLHGSNYFLRNAPFSANATAALRQASPPTVVGYSRLMGDDEAARWPARS